MKALTRPARPTISLLTWLAGGAVLGFVTVILGEMAAILTLLPVLLVAGFNLWKRPRYGLYAYIIFLPIHSLSLTLLLVHANLPINLVRVVAAWKELLLVATLVVVLLRLLSNSLPVRLLWIDWIALAWGSLIVLYMLFHDALVGEPLPLVTRLYGARDWLLYLAPYFIGRFAILSPASQRRVLQSIILVGGLTSLIGLVDYFLIPTEWHVTLGVPRYFGEMLGLSYPEQQFGLPDNYWIHLGQRYRRAVSTHLSGQGFAIPFLVIMPAMVYNLFSRLTRWSYILWLLSTVALLLTITRMTILVCLVQGLWLLLLMRRRLHWLFAVSLATSIFVLAFGLSPPFQRYVIDTVTLNDSSTRVRPQQWADGWQDLQDHPLGHGLGSTGVTSARFGGEEIGSEAGYLKITGAMGWLGLVLMLAWFLSLVLINGQAYSSHTGITQGLMLVTLVAALGFLLNNLTAPPDQSPFTIYVFSWLAGLSVQLATRNPQHVENLPGNVGP